MKNLQFIPTEQDEKIAFELYGIEGKAVLLNGELDQNFCISTEQKKYLLKVCHKACKPDYLDYQYQILEHLSQKGIAISKVIHTKDGHAIGSYSDDTGQKTSIRMLSWLEGRLWSSVNPIQYNLRFQLGETAGRITGALMDFDHASAHRYLDWDNAQIKWTFEHFHLFESAQKKRIQQACKYIESKLKPFENLRKSVIHNDLNDNNLIVSNASIDPAFIAPIDFGDAIHTHIIHDVGIACAYLSMGQVDMLESVKAFIEGYHHTFPLQEEELDVLYASILSRLVISLTKAAINQIEAPDHSYHQISNAGAWQALEDWLVIDPEFASMNFRAFCNLESCPKFDTFSKLVKSIDIKVSDLFAEIKQENIKYLDLGMESKILGNFIDFEDQELFEYKLNKIRKAHPNTILAGGYGEIRPVYQTASFIEKRNEGKAYRSQHLGIDFWLASGTAIKTLWDGEIHLSTYIDVAKDYGGLIITKHQLKGATFYLLHGHLSKASVHHFSVGDKIQKGDIIGYLGNQKENGGWVPHLHFQVILDMMQEKENFPGVCAPDRFKVWKSICPDPNLLFKAKNLDATLAISKAQLLEFRKKHLGKSLSLLYDVPLKITRGSGAYLIDDQGQKYLDTANNVAHVGHEHPMVVKAGQEQMALLNTNTRYLHEQINILAAELLSTLPEELSVLHFVNSGSEANELAIRMAKTYTQGVDIIVSESGYHGNTNLCVDISAYKFNGKGGKGAADYVHVIPLPDPFRGKYQGKFSGEKYAREVLNCIQKLNNRPLAAFIIESIISCGGQIELPDGFLKEAFHYVRQASGICISDEVQTGLGRIGTHWWGFEAHDVIPDIVTIGKPLGNGHPVAAVACTQAVAESFANGMEYFNTFGGNPVSCAIGTAVIQTIKKEELMLHAKTVGQQLKQKLTQLSKTYPIIADVRGQGLFLGVEFTDDQKNPLPEKVAYLANRMKAHKILMSVDGPQNNVLKIKPPLVFSHRQAEELIQVLQKILKEDFMQ